MNPLTRNGLAAAGMACLMALAGGCAHVSGRSSFDAGFFASRETNIFGSVCMRALGPFVETTTTPQGDSFVAVRPFYSRLEQPAQERVLKEYLWPVGMSRLLKNDCSWRFLLAYGQDPRVDDDTSTYRAGLFPILFMGRSKDGHDYLGVVPFGGKVYDFLLQDEVTFVLFPLYAHSRRNDLQSTSVLWPVYTREAGPGVSRFRVFPFYGYAHADRRWTKRFVLWPFWNSVEYHYPRSQGHGYMLFPLWGHMDLSDQNTWWVLPPFFRWSKSKDYTRVFAPWPFIKYTAGKTERQLSFWPLWGHKDDDTRSSQFFLWPIGAHSDRTSGSMRVKNTRLFPVYQSETCVPCVASNTVAGVTNKSADAASRYLRIWPLLSYQRVGDAGVLRVPDLWLARTPAVDRNFTPLWTLYSRLQKQDASEHEVLWGLYRQRRDTDGGRAVALFPFFSYQRHGSAVATNEVKQVSLLAGLIQYRRENSQSRWRLLYKLGWQTNRSRSE